jgi:DNA-3-methyladenine glycosylase I
MPAKKSRCHWVGADPIYLDYHDEEWGVPEYDDRALFEKLILDGFQAGLSWLTILKKRDNFRLAFDGFEPEKIARYRPAKLEKLMQDKGIVRNRAKIQGTVLNAKGWLEIMAERGSFSDYLWDYVDGEPVQNRLLDASGYPTESEASRALSKDLKARGWKFVGPTIVYAFMQAVGMVNDHELTCHRYKAVTKMAAKK